MSTHPSQRTRAFLRQELPVWRAEGILDASAERTLRERYGLGERASAGLALGALYVLAAAMVGAGVVSLVAWHWDDMPRWSRLLLLGAAVVGSHLAGFRMWKVTGRQPRLGHALSLLGTVLFGASIALVAQMYQVSGPWYGMFGAWAVGALVAGLVLPSLPTAGLAVFLGLFVWGTGFVADHASMGDGVAWAAGAGALVLAWRFRSRVLFLLAAGGLGLVVAVAATPHGPGAWNESPLAGIGAALAVAACCSALAARGEGDGLLRFGPPAAWLGRIALYVLGYAMSFEEYARELVRNPASWSRAWLTCVLPPTLAAFALLVPAWLARRGVAHLRWIAAITFAFPLLAFVTGAAHPVPLSLALVANVAVLGVAAARMSHGLAARARVPFWEGLAVAALVAVSRFFEIERLLWLKGVGFIVCGLVVVAAGLAFERGLGSEELEVHHG